jgi:hypothetical protein
MIWMGSAPSTGKSCSRGAAANAGGRRTARRRFGVGPIFDKVTAAPSTAIRLIGGADDC